jgi:hypothetical protein
MLTQKQIFVILNSKKYVELRQQINRSRLKFNIHTLASYLYWIVLQNNTRTTFKQLHHELYMEHKVSINYSTFMSNVKTIAPLMKYLFNLFNRTQNVKPSTLVNIVDTTLINDKQTKSIHRRDWKNERVTTRGSGVDKYHVCGVKGLVFMNRQKLVYLAEFMPINNSDQNILKSTCNYNNALKGFVLADRGFSNKVVRDRITNNKNDIWHNDDLRCRLISPYVRKSKTQLTEKEKKLYKYRWRIETLFQKVKHVYSETPLQLHGGFTKQLKEAKFFATWICYNAKTLNA